MNRHKESPLRNASKPHLDIHRNHSDLHSRSHEYEKSTSDIILIFFNFCVILPLLAITFRRTARMGSFSPPGFSNAPVTKGFVYFTLFFSLFIAFQNSAGGPLALHWWRSGPKFIYSLATYQLYFTSVWQTICGCTLLYHFRLFERQWGVRKYGTFCLSMLLVSGALGLALLVLGRDGIINEIACGPYGPLFATMVQVITHLYPTRPSSPLSLLITFAHACSSIATFPRSITSRSSAST